MRDLIDKVDLSSLLLMICAQLCLLPSFEERGSGAMRAVARYEYTEDQTRQ